jgi:predicted component of type VI protein secretion system
VAGAHGHAGGGVNQKPTAHALNAILRDAQSRPWLHGFIPLLRKLAAAEPDMPQVGQAQRPQQENFRLGQQASLAFAPRELAKVDIQRDSKDKARAHIKLFGLGALGPNGALPIHFTELVRERVEAKRDNTLANFLDLFHHRAFTHIYRAWAQSQSAPGLDRTAEETFTPYLRLTPQGSASGKDLPALIEIVRSFVGFEYVWEVQLLIRSDAAPQAQLGSNTQLGWSTWMATDGLRAAQAQPVTGMIFEPESYSE